MPLLGVILCGGQSSRMGSDKGLLRSGDATWAQLALHKFESLSLNVVLSIRESQYEEYAALFSKDQLIMDDDGSSIGGPLKGLLSVHDRFPDNDLFVLACDLPMMDRYVMEHLCREHENHQAEVTLFSNDNQIEPLCAIYSAAGLAKTKIDYTQQKLNKYSLHHIIGRLSSYSILLRKEWQSSFQNFNSPDDLASSFNLSQE
ncbi:MAG: molybdenum cofactor guanylyltransferase [Chryseolinea sp.]